MGIAAVWFIYDKIKDDFLVQLNQIKLVSINNALIGLAIILLLLNWGIEAFKWQFAIREIQRITIIKSFKLTITGITMGLLTPNRIGEIPARALLLNKENFKELTLKTSVSSFSQVVITYLMGVIGIGVNYQHLSFSINPLVLVFVLSLGFIFLLVAYFKINKLDFLFKKISYLRDEKIIDALRTCSKEELSKLLLMSFLRYCVFSLQFYLVLAAFGIYLNTIEDVFLISVCFMITSFIPTILISELGVRGSVALFVFGIVSMLDIHIFLASVSLWIINVAIPALFGLFNLKELKILKES